MRGLVVSPPIEHSAGQLLVKSADLDAQELRFSLLFWDKLDFPVNNVIRLGSSPDVEFLTKVGVLQRTEVRIQLSGKMEDLYRLAHVGAFQMLDTAEPGRWSIATGERSISFLDTELTTGRGALVALHRAIPIPDKDVPLQDVLVFREKRKSELLALRHYLELIYQRVTRAGDGPLAWNSEVEALDKAVSDYIKSTKGIGLKLRLASMEASLNLASAGLAGFLAQRAGLSAVETALAMVTGAAISLKVGAALSRRMVTDTPFRYVSSFHNELFRPA